MLSAMLHHPLMPGVRLRLPEESDAEPMYAVVERNREYLARWMPWAQTETLEDARAFIRLTRRQIADNNGLQTLIDVDGAPGGMIGLVGITWKDRTTELGYWLAAEHQGRGIMTAAVRAYADYAFGTLGLNRVALVAGVENHRSRAVAERAGFRQEGVARDGELLPSGYHDVVLYAQLAAEWRALRGGGEIGAAVRVADAAEPRGPSTRGADQCLLARLLDRPAQPLAQRHGRFPPEDLAGQGDIGLADLGVVDRQRLVDDL